VSFHDWTENAPNYTNVYDVSSLAGWQSFYTRYTGGIGNPPLFRIIEIAAAHGVRSILVETRYIDADWRSEHARFYSTTYARYPSVAHRAHFFTTDLPDDLGDLSEVVDAYRGYSVLRPLPSSPVGRTMIAPPPELDSGTRCEAVEHVDVLGWHMKVRGMPFISQDAQYLRCAHADLWMVMRHAYLRHQLGRKLPAQVHDATMGGLIVGRQVPSEGLSVQQMLGGMSALGLSPAILPLPQSEAESAANGILGLFDILCRYVNSNIAPLVSSGTHVWMIVGYVRKPSGGHPNLTLYRHDDAAGPYISVDDPWNEANSAHQPWARAMLPLPPKIYMTAERAEAIGRWWFNRWIGTAPSDNPLRKASDSGVLTFRTYGMDSSEFKFALNARGFDAAVARQYRLASWPRNLWVVEAVDRQLRHTTGENVLGEIIIDPTASHDASPHEPGILAAHSPGFWWQTAPDGGPEADGQCAITPYASGRPVYE
jgi:hypothetical protein